MAAERISAKRYGVRYGRKLRAKIGKIDREKHQSNTCPFCHYKSVKRLSVGIYLCGKCKNKFADRAYFLGKKLEGIEIATQISEPAKT